MAESIPQKLMVGLIYPAVLGSIIYSFYDVFVSRIYTPFQSINDLITMPSATNYLDGSWGIFAVKTALVILTIVFYCLDYLYTIYTKKFQLLFFFLGIGILVCIVVIFKLIDIKSTSPPFSSLISLFYFVFMMLYLWWDLKEKAESEDEKQLYKDMIKWEKLFAFIFLALSVVCFLERYLVKWLNHYFWDALVIFAIGWASWRFRALVIRKKRRYEAAA